MGGGGGAATIRGDNAGSGTALREAYANSQRQRNRGEEITSTSAAVVLATTRPPDHPTTRYTGNSPLRESLCCLSYLAMRVGAFLCQSYVHDHCVVYSLVKKCFLTKFINYEKNLQNRFTLQNNFVNFLYFYSFISKI